MTAEIDESKSGTDLQTSAGTRKTPIGRILVGSMLTGAAVAASLTLAVFPGAVEGRIAGAALLGFGTGWGMLTGLSARRAEQPQRWASVPAAAMTATGLALLAFPMGDKALTAAAWAWPAGMLALTVWINAKTRRSLTRRARLLLAPLLAFLVVSSVGATYQNIATVSDRSIGPAAGRTFEVNGHRLHLECRGQGGPTVVLFNGLGEFSTSWARIIDEASQDGRVCAYDRAGQGWSDSIGEPQDAATAAQDLHELLREAGEPGPYVLVGHSTGGAYAMAYASRHLDQVAGVVLLDSTSPEQFTRMPDYPGQYRVMRRATALLPTMWRIGAGRLLGAVAKSHLPAAAAERVKVVTASTAWARNMRDEVSVIPAVLDQAQALHTLGDLPLAVVTASENVAKMTGWSAAQAHLALLSSNHTHRVVGGSHSALLEEKKQAAESVRAIRDVVAAVRNKTGVVPR